MSIFSILLLTLVLILVVSQFGSRLAARNAIVWWFASGFIIVSAVHPEILHPLTSFLGIQVISNFVLAVLILFLFLQLIEQAAETTLQSRRTRQIVSSLAADSYLQAKAPADTTSKKSVLIVLPCFNEEDALPRTIKDIQDLQKEEKDGAFTYHVCFVDDGSTDASRQILAKVCPAEFTGHKVNLGVSGALLTGFEICRRMEIDYIVQCDSDGQHPVASIPALVQFADDKNVDLVVGSRFFGNPQKADFTGSGSTTRTRVAGIYMIRYMLGLFGKNAKVLDPTSGFRVYSKRARALLNRTMPDEYPEPESIAILAVKGLRIGEYYIEMMPRNTGVSSLSGIKSIRFMVKVISALIGLRLRSLVPGKSYGI